MWSRGRVHAHTHARPHAHTQTHTHAQVAHQLAKEVVEHGGEAVNKGWVTEDGLDVGGQLLQRVDGVVGHDVVVARHHAQLPQQPLLLLTLLRGQVIPRP